MIRTSYWTWWKSFMDFQPICWTLGAPALSNDHITLLEIHIGEGLSSLFCWTTKVSCERFTRFFRAYTRGVWHNHVGFFWAVFDTNLGILSYLIILDLSSSICKSENTVHELHARREHIHALLGSVREIQLDNLKATWYELQWFSLKL